MYHYQTSDLLDQVWSAYYIAVVNVDSAAMQFKQLNLAEAKANLSRLVDQAARGKAVVIAKAGLPIAKLVPISAEMKKIKFGVLEGRLNKRAIAALEAPLDQETLDLMNAGAIFASEQA
jgi:prevent-host-death family protein